MTPQEFKAWFEGFTEAFTATPTKAQWARIKARVADINGTPVTDRVFVERYWPRNYPGLVWPTSTWSEAQSLGFTETLTSEAPFNSMQCMTALGRYDAAKIQ